MRASHDSANSSESERGHLDRLDATLKKSSKSTKELSLCNVQSKLYTSKKENTCKSCGITYENFQTLLNHSCLPYRCAFCSMAFLFDYMLKMHKCGPVQPLAKSFHQTHYCEICGSAFFEMNALLRHQSQCTETKKCSKCGRTLLIKNGCKFCRKCSLMDKDQKYYLRGKNFNKFETATISSEVSSSGIESSIETDSVSTDQSNSTFNDIGSFAGLEFSKWRKKRKSIEGASDQSSKKIKSQKILKEGSCKSAEKSSVTTDHNESIPNGDTCKSLNLSNWGRQTSKNGSNPKELEKTVKSKSCLPIDSLKDKIKARRNFEKNGNNLLLNKSFIKSNNVMKLTVHESLLAKQEMKSDLKSVVSVLSQTGKKNQMEKKKAKFSSANCSNSRKIKESKPVASEKINNVISSDYTRPLKKNDSTKASKNEDLSAETNSLECSLLKSPASVGNTPKSIKKSDVEGAKKKRGDSQSNSKRKSRLSGERTNLSNINSCTPTIQISSSSPKSLPDTVSPVRRHSKSSPSCSKDIDPEKNKVVKKKSDILNSPSDTIRLESILHVLPDEESGILLKESTKSSDNFRCPKCNKLFKKAKMAIIHYANCKSFRLKKKMLVTLEGIEWICLQCHFHCTQIPELNLHRRSCPRLSFNAFSEYSIGQYADSPLNYCSKCSFSCMSSIMFNQHQCEKRLEHMKKCYIGIEKLTSTNISNLSKYECNYCESIFYSYTAYKKHIDRHKPDEFSDTVVRNVANEKLYANREIKKIIQETKNVKTSDDVIKKLLEPISQICSSMDSENPFPNLNLNLVIPTEIDALFRGAAEKILAADKDNLNKPDNFLNVADFADQIFNPVASSSNCDTGAASESFRSYMKDFSCEHSNCDSSDVEKKPCITCLTKYHEEKGAFKSKDTEFDQETDYSNLPGTSAVMTHNSEIYNLGGESMLHEFRNSVPLVNQEAVPIHIASVQSCSYEAAAGNPIFQSLENDCIPAAACHPCSESELLKVASASSTHNSDEDDVMLKKVLFVVVVEGKFIESRYTVKGHNDLVKRLYNLKLVYMPEESGKLSQVKDDEYYLHTDEKEEIAIKYNTFVQTDHFLAFNDLAVSNSTKDYTSEFSVSSTDNISHHPKTPETSPTVRSPVHCAQFDDTLDKVHSDFESRINLSPILQHGSIDQHDESVSVVSSDDIQNHASQIDIFNGNAPSLKKYKDGVKNYVSLECPFEELMKLLVTQKPCDFDLIVILSKFIIHISWQTFPQTPYTAYTQPDSQPSNISFICGLCFDSISMSLFLKHYLDDHEGLRILNILIS